MCVCTCIVYVCPLEGVCVCVCVGGRSPRVPGGVLWGTWVCTRVGALSSSVLRGCCATRVFLLVSPHQVSVPGALRGMYTSVNHWAPL